MRSMQARPWLMAAACSDQYVRIYDRRKMSVRAPTGSHASTPLLSLAPLHMLLDRSGTNTCHTTCARFSHRGDKVLANYHSDQVRCWGPHPCLFSVFLLQILQENALVFMLVCGYCLIAGIAFGLALRSSVGASLQEMCVR